MTDLRRVRGRGQADLALPGGAGLHTTRGYKRCQGGGLAGGVGGGVAVQGVGSVCVNVDNNVCVLLVVSSVGCTCCSPTSEPLLVPLSCVMPAPGEPRLPRLPRLALSQWRVGSSHFCGHSVSAEVRHQPPHPPGPSPAPPPPPGARAAPACSR